MTKRFAFLLLIFIPLLHSCQQSKKSTELVLPSPDLKVHIYFNLNSGEPYYLVYFNKEIIIDWSLMGFKLADSLNFTEGLRLKKTESKSFHAGEAQDTNSGNQSSKNYNELIVFLQKENDPIEQLIIVLRAFDNGIAFTYLFPENEKSETVTLVSEETQFDLYGSDSNWMPVSEADSTREILHVNEDNNNDLFDLPAEFISSDGIIVTLSEIPAKDILHVKLERRTDDKPQYSVRFKGDIPSEGIEFQRNLYSSWRFIQIQKY